MAQVTLRYDGPHVDVEIAETGQLVERGDTVTVDAKLAEGLLEQGATIELEFDDAGEVEARKVTPADKPNWKKVRAHKPADDGGAK